MSTQEPEAARLPVPVADWGRDHWSTLAYLETRVVDEGGRVDPYRMRCDGSRHPEKVRFTPGGAHGSGGYPTRLRGGVELAGHDDWDCLEDAIAAGLLKPQDGADKLRNRYALTELGELFCAKLRAHKGHGGSYDNFDACREKDQFGTPLSKLVP